VDAAPPKRARRSLGAWLGGERKTTEELAGELFLDTGDVRSKQSRFWVLLALATAIATAGLMADSTATVIGAMIVAPLGTPIMAVGLGIVIGNPKRLGMALAIVVGGAAAVIAFAAVLYWLLPEVIPIAKNGQIQSRTSPGTIDLAAAIATGFAGAFGLARRDVSDVLPGVAIAISLVPPLSVVGITIAAGEANLAAGAFLLFASNVVAMILAGVVMFTVYGFGADAWKAPTFRHRRAYLTLAVAVVVILIPLVVTTRQTLELQSRQTSAQSIAQAWANEQGEILAKVEFHGSELLVVVEGPQPPTGTDELLAELRAVLPAGTPVVLNYVAGTSTTLAT
jgi:uncharacterized hydrophobic protein (TIGR00341 family)